MDVTDFVAQNETKKCVRQTQTHTDREKDRERERLIHMWKWKILDFLGKSSFVSFPEESDVSYKWYHCHHALPQSNEALRHTHIHTLKFQFINGATSSSEIRFYFFFSLFISLVILRFVTFLITNENIRCIILLRGGLDSSSTITIYLYELGFAVFFSVEIVMPLYSVQCTHIIYQCKSFASSHTHKHTLA